MYIGVEKKNHARINEVKGRGTKKGKERRYEGKTEKGKGDKFRKLVDAKKREGV